MTAVDPDVQPTELGVSYGLEQTEDSRMFYVVEATGVLLTNASLDFELRRRYQLRVRAVQSARRPHRTATADVTVNVDDVNDHRPRFVFPPPGGTAVVEVT